MGARGRSMEVCMKGKVSDDVRLRKGQSFISGCTVFVNEGSVIFSSFFFFFLGGRGVTLCACPIWN